MYIYSYDVYIYSSDVPQLCNSLKCCSGVNVYSWWHSKMSHNWQILHINDVDGINVYIVSFFHLTRNFISMKRLWACLFISMAPICICLQYPSWKSPPLLIDDIIAFWFIVWHALNWLCYVKACSIFICTAKCQQGTGQKMEGYLYLLTLLIYLWQGIPLAGIQPVQNLKQIHFNTRYL